MYDALKAFASTVLMSLGVNVKDRNGKPVRIGSRVTWKCGNHTNVGTVKRFEAWGVRVHTTEQYRYGFNGNPDFRPRELIAPPGELTVIE